MAANNLGISRNAVTTAGNTTGSTQVSNMPASALATLEALIAQLAGGGTEEQRAAQQARNQEIATANAQRSSYSKEAAFADAEGAMASQLANALRQLLPGIVRSAEGAGTSRSSLQALLIQQAAADSAAKAAELGLQSSAQYGSIASNLTATLEALTRVDSPVTQSLIQALQVAKGAVQPSNPAGGTSVQAGYTPSSTVGGTRQSYVAPTKQTAYEAPSITYTPPLVSSPTSLSNAAWSGLMHATGSTGVDGLLEALGNNGGWSGFDF